MSSSFLSSFFLAAALFVPEERESLERHVAQPHAGCCRTVFGGSPLATQESRSDEAILTRAAPCSLVAPAAMVAEVSLPTRKARRRAHRQGKVEDVTAVEEDGGGFVCCTARGKRNAKEMFVSPPESLGISPWTVC